MATTLRYGTGFKGSNAKYVIRKKTSIHLYNEGNKAMVRVTKSLERRSVYNRSYDKNTSSTSLAMMSMDSSDGKRRRYVAIS